MAHRHLAVDGQLAVDEDAITTSGHTGVVAWLRDRWDDEAARHIMWQFLIFYGLLIVGFGSMYIMIRSTGQVRSKLRTIRKNVVEMVQDQRNRKFDLDQYNSNFSSGYI